MFQVPSTAEEFNKWNYPCCIGAIQQLANSSSEFNYKHFFSVLLLALVDANYKFLHVDVGAAGCVLRINTEKSIRNKHS